MLTSHRLSLLVIASVICQVLAATDVATIRCPNRGIQPQAALDSNGVLHLIYYRGEPAGGDIFYVKSADNGATFSAPIPVNSQASSAIAIGNMRGAHLALGKNGRVHVAWNGSTTAEPKGPRKSDTPMLYARMNDAQTAFEPQRSVITAHYGLDGGGAIAADGKGGVTVLWHGQSDPTLRGEENRRVWVARSTDDGKTFAAETPASDDSIGICSCCGMSAGTDTSGNVVALYRAALQGTDRGMHLLASKPGGSFSNLKLDSWQLSSCPLSSSTFFQAPSGLRCAWENNGQIFFANTANDLKSTPPIPAPGPAKGRKHPAIAVNAQNETLVVWTEGMGWEKGGTLAWQLYDKEGNPTAVKGAAPGVPKWSLVTAFATTKGGFAIVY